MHGTQVLGFRASLAEALFGWWRSAEMCQECHVNQYLRELRAAVADGRVPRSIVCDLPPLSVLPVAEGSTGRYKTWL